MKRLIATALAVGCLVSSTPVFAGDDPSVFDKWLNPGARECVPVSAFQSVSKVTNLTAEQLGLIAEKGLNWELSGCAVVHRRPRPVANLRVASVNKWRLEDKRVALVRMRIAFARIVATTPHAPWVSEEAIKAQRPRNLLEDNPASG